MIRVESAQYFLDLLGSWLERSEKGIYVLNNVILKEVENLTTEEEILSYNVVERMKELIDTN